jgi:hypothetical protein
MIASMAWTSTPRTTPSSPSPPAPSSFVVPAFAIIVVVVVVVVVVECGGKTSGVRPLVVSGFRVKV